VTCLGVALDAHQGGEAGLRERRDERVEVRSVEDLDPVALAVLGCETRTVALADAFGVVERVRRCRSSVVGASSRTCR
jgi:hypothetical protein